jgi:hypothetical protein
MGLWGSGDDPYPPRTASTLFLPVPPEDWARVKQGLKTEFRTTQGRKPPFRPTPVVAYDPEGHDQIMMVLEGYRYEQVFFISERPDSIEREGFGSYDDFRDYWKRRNKDGVYRPTERVHVWQVRRWEAEDYDTMGAILLDQLYGESLDRRLQPSGV